MKKIDRTLTSEEVIHEMWAVHQALRMFGFKPEEIFVSGAVIHPETRKPCIGVVLQAQDKEFGIPIDKSNDPKLFDKWKKFIETANTLSPRDTTLQTIWKKSRTCQSFGLMAKALIDKGFRLQPPRTAKPPDVTLAEPKKPSP